MSLPRILAIMGSGETAPTMVTTHRRLTSLLPTPVKAVVLVVTGYKLQFELAKRSLLDLLNVQNDQFNYRSSTVSNEYDYRIARFHFSGALGQLSRVYGGGEVQPQISEPAWMPWTR